MNQELLNSLTLNETDISGVMQRFSGDEKLYMALLNSFKDDPTMDELENAIARKEWNEAFTAAHALKGLAGNMGFVPLFHETGELVMFIRAGKISEIDISLKRVRNRYDDILNIIRNNEILTEGK